MDLVVSWANNRSKDPSSKVGAAIYDTEGGGVFLGYNGFPKGIPDDELVWTNRLTWDSGFDSNVGWSKYDLVIHAEVNAANKALRAGVKMDQAWLICTHLPCEKCMKDIIASHRISRIYYTNDSYNSCTEKTKTFAAYISRELSIHLERLPCLNPLTPSTSPGSTP